MTPKRMREIATDLEASAEDLRRNAAWWREEADRKDEEERRSREMPMWAALVLTAGGAGKTRGVA